jgi:acyl-CoA dehydrogenase
VQFDDALFGHVRFGISNAVRSFWFGLTGSRFGSAPGDAYTRRYFRKLDRYSANLALMADTSMLLLGGKLKFKESLSGRLGDVLSHMYMTSAMLKRHHDDGAPSRRPAAAGVGVPRQRAQDRGMRCRPRCATSRSARSAGCCGLVIFPFGRRAEAPGDRLSRRVAALLMSPNEARERLAEGVFLTPCENNPGGRINSYLPRW